MSSESAASKRKSSAGPASLGSPSAGHGRPLAVAVSFPEKSKSAVNTRESF